MILLSFACSQHVIEKENLRPDSYVKIGYSKMFGIANFKQYSQLFFLNQSDTIWSIKSNELSEQVKIGVMSSVFAGYLEVLNKQSHLVVLDNVHYYCDSLLLERFKQGHISEVGEEGQINLSQLLKAKPDVLVSSSFSGKDQSLLKRLKQAGIKVVFCDNFKEQNPLARAEWIKLFGFLMNAQSLADSVFKVVETNYQQQIKALNPNHKKPLILTDALYSDVWNVPGGKSYTAKLIQDAQGQYLFEGLNDLFSYPLSFEMVWKKAENCDIWLHVNQYKTKADLLNANKRYALLNVFNRSRIFNNNKRENAFGGNDFWEMGVVRPDLVLKDLIQIFNSSNISEDKLYFYTHVD